jgi:hypothetical protein
MLNDTTHPLIPASSLLRRLTVALALAAAVLASAPRAHAQGCVALKEIGAQSVPIDGVTATPGQDKWDLTETYEHFRSYLDYIGSHNNTPARTAASSQVINVVDQFDTSLTYDVDLSDSVSFDLPYFKATRSSLYEHDGVHRYKTRSSDFGDARGSFDRWLFNPAKNPRGNISVGLGLSAPTGKSNVKDYFHTKTGLVYHNVDQSIQPGSGGWGYIFEGSAYYRITATTSLYTNGFYMATPQDTNGTRTQSAITSETAYNSIEDQYELRGGVSQQVAHFEHGILSASLGGRWEGVPSLDLIGRSDGFRRPGYVLSVEPGVSFTLPHDSLSLSVPVVEYINRTQSYPDTLTGGHGDAFFAKFLVLITYSHRW